MVGLISEFFGIIGLNVVAPSNMSELIPYLLYVGAGLIMVSAVFRLFHTMVSIVLRPRF